MEIRLRHVYIIINCVMLINNLLAKSVSLNDLIAAEAKEKQDKSPLPKSAVSTKAKYSPKKTERVATAESEQKFEKTRLPGHLDIKLTRKPFWLKDLLADTKPRHRIEELLASKHLELTELFNHRKAHFPLIGKKFHLKEPRTSIGHSLKSLTPLKYKKAFHIKSPLKPKKIKHTLKPRHKRRNQPIRKENNDDENFNKKYIPLIKNLGMLVNDLLASGSDESPEVVERLKSKRNRYITGNKDRGNESKCTCSNKSDPEESESKPRKKTAAAPSTLTTENPAVTADTSTEASATAANNTPSSDVGTLRPNTNLSLLLTRNTTSPWRDNNGFSAGSGPTFHRDDERNITGHNGDGQYNSGGERYYTGSADDKKFSSSATRNISGSDGPVDRIFGDRTYTKYPKNRNQTKEAIQIASDDDGLFGRRDNDSEESKFQVGRNKDEEPVSIPGQLRGLRGLLPEDKVTDNRESIQPTETSEEGVINVAQNNTSTERFPQRNIESSSENQKLRQANETVISINGFPNLLIHNAQQNKQVVTIFDGYSVARDINGRNKLSEKSIHISS